MLILSLLKKNILSQGFLTAQMSVFMVFCGPHLPFDFQLVCGPGGGLPLFGCATAGGRRMQYN